MITEPIVETIPDVSRSPESTIVSMEQQQTLNKAIATLEEPYRKVFHLRIFGELSFREIGTACERNENWARVTYYRAKGILAKKMEDEYGKF